MGSKSVLETVDDLRPFARKPRLARTPAPNSEHRNQRFFDVSPTNISPPKPISVDRISYSEDTPTLETSIQHQKAITAKLQSSAAAEHIRKPSSISSRSSRNQPLKVERSQSVERKTSLENANGKILPNAKSATPTLRPESKITLLSPTFVKMADEEVAAITGPPIDDEEYSSRMAQNEATEVPQSRSSNVSRIKSKTPAADNAQLQSQANSVSRVSETINDKISSRLTQNHVAEKSNSRSSNVTEMRKSKTASAVPPTPQLEKNKSTTSSLSDNHIEPPPTKKSATPEIAPHHSRASSLRQAPLNSATEGKADVTPSPNPNKRALAVEDILASRADLRREKVSSYGKTPVAALLRRQQEPSGGTPYGEMLRHWKPSQPINIRSLLPRLDSPEIERDFSRGLMRSEHKYRDRTNSLDKYIERASEQSAVELRKLLQLKDSHNQKSRRLSGGGHRLLYDRSPRQYDSADAPAKPQKMFPLTRKIMNR